MKSYIIMQAADAALGSPPSLSKVTIAEFLAATASSQGTFPSENPIDKIIFIKILE